MRPVPRTSLRIAFAFALLGGCGLFDEPVSSTAPPVQYDVAAPALPAPAAQLPFDPRVARLLPQSYVGTEQLCDVVMLGAVRRLRPEEVYGYRLPFAAARHARCAGTTGEGWADLYFRKDREDLSEQITVGTRLRTIVLAGEGGFDDYTPVDVVAAVGPSPPDAPRRLITQEPGVADPFDDPPVDHEVRTCAVTYAGQIQRIADGVIEAQRDEERALEDTEVRYRVPRSPAPYPGSASHRLSVVCQHSSGESWVDVVFTRETFPSALDVVRGRTMALRVFRSDGGVGNHPITVFLPLGAAAPSPLRAAEPAAEQLDGGVEAAAEPPVPPGNMR
ncbi:MAG: hypothetical protein H6726_15570 [Sandaracinaceae bacterium]|nr:hypothetical protein [Sandaracinaceae bacterium]